jgi:hypothetical protein
MVFVNNIVGKEEESTYPCEAMMAVEWIDTTATRG